MATKKPCTLNLYLGTGIGLGMFSAIGLFTIGAFCPLCLVAAPTLIGVGLYQKVKCQHKK